MRPNEMFSRREFLKGAGLATLGIVGVRCNGGNDKQPLPTSKPVSTESPTNVSASTATSVPEPTKAAEPQAPVYGKYKTVEEAPFSSERKREIQKLTKDCTPFIITDEGMVVIENAHISGPPTVMYGNNEIPVSRLHSIKLNTAKFPNAEEMFDTALKLAKFEAWKYQSKQQDATFEDYMVSKSTAAHPFKVFGYDGTSDNLADRSLDDDTFIIIKILAEEDRANILWSVQSEYQNEVIGRVLARGIFTNNITKIGAVDRSGEEVKSGIGPTLAVALASMGGESIGNSTTSKFSMAGRSATLVPAINRIRAVLVPGYTDPPPSSTKDLESMFIITGTKIGK